LKIEDGKLRIGIDKSSEVAEPGYYAVTLDGGIKVEIAAAEHSAIYRISTREKLSLLVDCAYGIGGMNYAKRITASGVKLLGKSGLSGRNHRRQWVERDYSYVVNFSRECAAVSEMPRSKGVVAPQYVFDFDVGESPLLIKVALSAEGDVAAAADNLAAEIPAWDFNAVKRAARAKWNEVLGCATIDGTDEQKKNWYTSVYHLFIQPNNIADVGAKPFYSTFSTWDTFRAAHPLYTILAPEKAEVFVDSMLEQGSRTGYLPIWTLWGKDNQCMIGTHSVPVIVDWFLKEVGGMSSSSRTEDLLFPYSTSTLNFNSSSPNSLHQIIQNGFSSLENHAHVRKAHPPRLPCGRWREWICGIRRRSFW
jgi:putative alpha-1,2-mannosidase